MTADEYKERTRDSRIYFNISDNEKNVEREEEKDILVRHRNLYGEYCSIIILNRDGIDYTKKCIQSIYENTKNLSYEIIIIDNCSKDKRDIDGLKEIVEKVLPCEMKIMLLKRETGFGDANNQGIWEVLNKIKEKKDDKNKYIVIMNNDTEIITDNWLQKLIETMKNDPKIGIVGCQLIFQNGKIQHAGGKIDTKGETRHIGYKKEQSEETNGIYDVDYITGALMVIKRDVIDKIGGFDSETFQYYYEDVDYCLRAKELDYRVVYCGNVKVIHHEGITTNRFHPTITPRNVFVRKWNDKFTYDGRISNNIDNIRNFVIKGYRDVLKRDPDSVGLHHYIDHIYSGNITKDRFLEILRTSEEYKIRFGNT
jgi:GT2 family glycosyltransferase